MTVSINVEGVGKKYCRSLRRSMLYGVCDIGRNLAGLSSRPDRLRRDEFWAVQDISLNVGTGETLGVIGHNGAGKTTLLKMLNGIFWPDKGRITIQGRVGALIEVGAGFHPLLSGRDNIFLNGAILGMSRNELDRRFDRIVEFAGIGAFIDSPVKYYSSGMFVRLGFSVAAHCEPDILLVDEVLAVGDMAFQARCRERIRELKERGTTIVLVSHSLYTVSFVCSRTLVLDRGKRVFDGRTDEAVDVYRSRMAEQHPIVCSGSGEVKVKGVEVLDRCRMRCDEFRTGDEVCLRLRFESSETAKRAVFNLGVHQVGGGQVTDFRNDLDGEPIEVLRGKGAVDLVIGRCNLFPGVYTVNATLFHSDGFSIYDRIERIASFRVSGGRYVNGTTYFPHTWEEAPASGTTGAGS